MRGFMPRTYPSGRPKHASGRRDGWTRATSARATEVGRKDRRQKGLTIAMMTMTIMRTVGTSLAKR